MTHHNSTIRALRAAAEVLAEELFTDESGKFWGSAGAGGLFYAEDTGRVLVQKRSPAVNEPNTWGVWGGKIDHGESPERALQREVKEEAGYRGAYNLEKVYTFKDGKFRYDNYLIVVPEEFEPRHGWESSDHEWADVDDLPSPLHFGLKAALPSFKRAAQKRQRKDVAAALRAAAEVLGRDINRVDPKKFYVVVPISRLDQEARLMKDISKGVLDGVQGISGKSAIIMHWYGIGRNGVIVMDQKKTAALNKLSRIQYKNPDYLSSKGLAALYRIWDKGADNHRGVAHNLVQGMLRRYKTARPKGEPIKKALNAAQVSLNASAKKMLRGLEDFGDDKDIIGEMDFLDASDVERFASSAKRVADELSKYNDYKEDDLRQYLSTGLRLALDRADYWRDVVGTHLAAKDRSESYIANYYEDEGHSDALRTLTEGMQEFSDALTEAEGLQDVIDDTKQVLSHMGTLVYNVRYSFNTYADVLTDFLAAKGKNIQTAKGLAKVVHKLWTTDPEISQHVRTEFKKVPFSIWHEFVLGGLRDAGEVYGDEGEWLVKNKKLKVPKGSILYVTEGKLYDAIIEEFDLDRHYKVKRIDHNKMEKARTKWHVRRMGGS
jgi:8-oxo-dGTP pyrophosphatase MutT (NUDIX family)